ncbi:unnamed protein product, partial [Effrenium voratum]
ILNMSANPDHPFHVACGNNKMLRDDPKEKGLDLYAEMKSFYEAFYSANGMTLSVIGKESIEELQAMIREKFGGVVDKNLELPMGDAVSSHPPFVPKDWNRLLLQSPVKDIKSLPARESARGKALGLRLFRDLSLAMAPLLDITYTSRAGMLLGDLLLPQKPGEELLDDSLPPRAPQAVASLFQHLISPQSSFCEEAPEVSPDIPMKPDRETHELYLKAVDRYLKDVHRAPEKLEMSVESKRRATFGSLFDSSKPLPICVNWKKSGQVPLVPAKRNARADCMTTL